MYRVQQYSICQSSLYPLGLCPTSPKRYTTTAVVLVTESPYCRSGVTVCVVLWGSWRRGERQINDHILKSDIFLEGDCALSV